MRRPGTLFKTQPRVLAPSAVSRVSQMKMFAINQNGQANTQGAGQAKGGDTEGFVIGKSIQTPGANPIIPIGGTPSEGVATETAPCCAMTPNASYASIAAVLTLTGGSATRIHKKHHINSYVFLSLHLLNLASSSGLYERNLEMLVLELVPK